MNWNVRDLLRDCLNSVYCKTSLPTDQFEIIVVDNASVDDSVDMVKQEFPDVVCLDNSENIGFGAANNQALEFCNGEFILLLNPDTEILDNAIDKMLEIMQAKSRTIDILGCRLLNTDGSLQRWTAGHFPALWNVAYHALFINYVLGKWGPTSSIFLNYDIATEIEVDWICGACLMIRQKAIPGELFSRDYFMYGEDMELCSRVKTEGGRILYSPVASIFHHHGQSVKKVKGPLSFNALEGQRRLYIEMNGRTWIYLYDTLIATGFFLRSFCFMVMAVFTRRDSFFERAQANILNAKQAMHFIWRQRKS